MTRRSRVIRLRSLNCRATHHYTHLFVEMLFSSSSSSCVQIATVAIIVTIVVTICCTTSCAYAAPLDDPKHATVLRYENDNIGLDGYKFA